MKLKFLDYITKKEIEHFIVSYQGQDYWLGLNETIEPNKPILIKNNDLTYSLSKTNFRYLQDDLITENNDTRNVFQILATTNRMINNCYLVKDVDNDNYSKEDLFSLVEFIKTNFSEKEINQTSTKQLLDVWNYNRSKIVEI